MPATRTPASIRYNNPGAMWGRTGKRPGPEREVDTNAPLALRWGSKRTVYLSDGLNQGNNIALFPDFVHGAAAQFDLWRTRYTGITLKAAILKWSGGNWSAGYARFLTEQTGIGMDAIVDNALLSSSQGWKLLKAQSHWEAGMPIPMTDSEWQQAQALCFGTMKPVSPVTKKVVVATAAPVIVATTAAVGQSHHVSGGLIFAAVLAVIAIGVGLFIYFHNRTDGAVVGHTKLEG